MRTILLCLLAFSLTQYNSFGQNSITFNKPIEIILNKNYSQELKKGSKIVISSVEKKTEASGYYEFNYIGTDSIGNQYYLKENLVEDAVFPINPSIEQVWEIGLIKNKVYKNLLLNGYQYDIRSELNKEAESYLNILHDKNLFFSDAYLEDYLYKILNKIHKGYLTDKRPGNLSVRVIKDATPNAIALSNGCILLTTGLLSCLNSESQLAGILAHEVTHFVNDHHILSYTKEQARLKRAEFWTAVVTGLAVASDVYLATNNQNYTYGLLSPTTAIAATLISESIVERMGIKYSHNQEFEADFTAKSVLVSLGLDDYSFATALYLLEKNFYLSGNYSALIGGKTHPSIQERVYRLGFFYKSDTIKNEIYDAKLSFVNTYNAEVLFYAKSDFLAALNLVNRNISANAGSGEDYLIKSRIIRRLSDTRESNLEALESLNKSRHLNPDKLLGLDKDESIIRIRLNEKKIAKECLDRYLSSLYEALEESIKIMNIDYQAYLNKEIIWTKNMITKLESL